MRVVVWKAAKNCAFRAICIAAMMATGNLVLSIHAIAVWTSNHSNSICSPPSISFWAAFKTSRLMGISRHRFFGGNMAVSYKTFTGSDTGFDYRLLGGIASNETVEKYCRSFRERMRKVKALPESLDEWIVRTYSATKLLLGATVMLSSAEYVSRKGVRIAEPYLLYYSLFNTSRSAVLMIPEQGWNSGSLLDSMTHTKVINLTTDLLRRISVPTSEAYYTLVQHSLDTRELFSYKFPAKGLKGANVSVPDLAKVADCCALLGELAQLMSECVETEFAPLAKPYGDFEDYPLKRIFEYKSRYDELIDDDDYYRLGYILRHRGGPASIASTATEGLVEDFFSSWDFVDEEEGDSYHPNNWQLIFPFT